MNERIRWGILGTGAVANRFAAALSNLPEQAELLAVGSRRQETADAFAEKHRIPRRYASYAALAADPDVDVVYIGTPHLTHHRDATRSRELASQGQHERGLAGPPEGGSAHADDADPWGQANGPR